MPANHLQLTAGTGSLRIGCRLPATDARPRNKSRTCHMYNTETVLISITHTYTRLAASFRHKTKLSLSSVIERLTTLYSSIHRVPPPQRKPPNQQSTKIVLKIVWLRCYILHQKHLSVEAEECNKLEMNILRTTQFVT